MQLRACWVSKALAGFMTLSKECWRFEAAVSERVRVTHRSDPANIGRALPALKCGTGTAIAAVVVYYSIDGPKSSQAGYVSC